MLKKVRSMVVEVVVSVKLAAVGSPRPDVDSVVFGSLLDVLFSAVLKTGVVGVVFNKVMFRKLPSSNVRRARVASVLNPVAVDSVVRPVAGHVQVVTSVMSGSSVWVISAVGIVLA